MIKIGENDVGKSVRVTIELMLGATDKNSSNKNKRKLNNAINRVLSSLKRNYR